MYLREALNQSEEENVYLNLGSTLDGYAKKLEYRIKVVR